ncbi:Ras-like G protein, putative [Plasmodium ovale]|uniref:Ras-like G protein, putative n=1 Tax=Plasmodium ovale TaxID=36330 RepID=A0A1C3KS13_PLAOA|nr:Ras-like G protein, putative [Plasmodium ovale]
MHVRIYKIKIQLVSCSVKIYIIIRVDMGIVVGSFISRITRYFCYRISIVGATNSGKSSLHNYLLEDFKVNYKKSTVNEIENDYIENNENMFEYKGRKCLMVDTIGINKEMMNKIKEWKLSKYDLKLQSNTILKNYYNNILSSNLILICLKASNIRHCDVITYNFISDMYKKRDNIFTVVFNDIHDNIPLDLQFNFVFAYEYFHNVLFFPHPVHTYEGALNLVTVIEEKLAEDASTYEADGKMEAATGGGREDRAVSGREDRAVSGREDRAMSGREDRAMSGREDRAVSRREDAAGSGREDRAVSGREDAAGSGREDAASHDREDAHMRDFIDESLRIFQPSLSEETKNYFYKFVDIRKKDKANNKLFNECFSEKILNRRLRTISEEELHRREIRVRKGVENPIEAQGIEAPTQRGDEKHRVGEKRKIIGTLKNRRLQLLKSIICRERNANPYHLIRLSRGHLPDSENGSEGGSQHASEGGSQHASEGGSQHASEGGNQHASEGGSQHASEGGSHHASEWRNVQGGEWRNEQGGEWRNEQGGEWRNEQGGEWRNVQGGEWRNEQGGEHGDTLASKEDSTCDHGENKPCGEMEKPEHGNSVPVEEKNRKRHVEIMQKNGEIKICVLGEKNCGKTTLVECMLKKSIVNERDIYELFGKRKYVKNDMSIYYKNIKINILDTCSLKKHHNFRKEDFFYDDKDRVYTNIRKSDMCIYIKEVKNNSISLNKHDKKMLYYLLNEKKNIIFLVNKINLIITDYEKKRKEFLKNFSYNFNDIPVIFFNSNINLHIKMLLNIVLNIHKRNNVMIPTYTLNMFLMKFLKIFPIPWLNKKKCNFKFIKQIKINPVTFLIFTNLYKQIPNNYFSFFKKKLKNEFDFKYVNVQFVFKTTCDNGNVRRNQIIRAKRQR